MIERNIAALKSKVFDIVVIGGGVTGCAIAMEASQRGLKVALIEKDDFSSGTSGASSKLIHGGLRYLEQGEIGVVRECLRERRLLQISAPHLVKPLPFLFPIYKDFGPGKLLMKAGFGVYDLLSYDKNRIIDEEQHLANAKWISKEEALKFESSLDPEGLKGAYVYYDCASVHPDRLTLEFALTANANGAVLANHVRANAPWLEGEDVAGVVVQDTLGEEEDFIVYADLVVNAGGPWCDEVVYFLDGLDSMTIVKSIGLHILVPPVLSQNSSTLAMATRQHAHFFIIPWRGLNLIGTTDTAYEGSMDELSLPEKQIEDFVAMINEHIPNANIEMKDIIHSYVGARPLIAKKGKDPYKASRKHDIIDHVKHGGRDGIMTVLGGKYTTSRSLAEVVVKKAVKKLNIDASESISSEVRMHSGHTGNVNTFVSEAFTEFSGISPQIINHLIEFYGSSFREVLYYGQKNKRLMKTIGKNTQNLPNILAEIHYSVEKESARTLNDFVIRRSGIGHMGHPGKSYLQKIAKEMAVLLSWNAVRIKEEIASFEKFAPPGGPFA